jgi:DNA-binding GntR family transcriptional regulator
MHAHRIIHIRRRRTEKRVPIVTDVYSTLDTFISGDRRLLRSREIAYEAIKDAILRGAFEPRERLIEERLGEALQLSRTPVREALAILEHEGLIESIPYKGLMVRAITVDEFLNMYEALGVIEPHLARPAAINATSADIATMTAMLDRAEAAIPDDVPGHLAANRAFQAHLGQCARKPFLTRMLLSIEERSDMYLIHSHQALPPEKMLAAVQDRRRILTAVAAADPDAAAAAAAAHGEAIRVRWRALYPEHPATNR